jgi:putative nucleotidyltransferase with HDIG domain
MTRLDDEDLKHSPNRFRSFLSNEGFIDGFSIPLISKGRVIGILEVFNKAKMAVDDEWIKFLETIAPQAAIAIENSKLFENLQKSNLSLTIAYDETIEGWSHALDLRDKETEGHTQRVTDITLALAEQMGLAEEDCKYIRWGALLHDIGKMGIPDSILLKPGPLTDDEWKIMRRHPQYAYDLLKPISYLEKSVEIPLYHHEKWDGTGYPHGEKGKQIPLGARIFSVVDVWDALTSHRPYRPAWTQEQAREYILEQSGKHFDPEIVDVFMTFLVQNILP